MTEPGRRERKKAANRQALADAALRLFLERGYDAVGVREIADAADVSVATLFKHFPGGKEALVFDQDADREAALVAAVRERPSGQSIPQALRTLLRDERSRQVRTDPRFPDFLHLIDTTPALREHARRMWLRHENALAAAIVADSGLPDGDPAAQALAHFALEAVSLVHGRDDSERALDRIFTLLDDGWTATAQKSARRDSD
ncbi:putative TetR family transcriptional regulator [Nocardia brasiliensis NBRC 14402]|uniref:TetR/AcrR family transcriptional regulator n=1 Tax=Nocardia brasiliensis TaxID=37326 RepID=UPI0002EED164|nr:TetR/AcrR family transcriptional regulator [Nocardia brasiliensis]ASF07532.1 TetR family transcriptional regulator [Nocardia brasiliensis]GAJ81859.1 putative TetR family transcriptional regulator [Nocardia brasiliensis NBRC 14402]SUB55515.1 HTH-type transcriptional repressor AcnR [Nocardia brasiliensis]